MLSILMVLEAVGDALGDVFVTFVGGWGGGGVGVVAREAAGAGERAGGEV
jgi:hypothetical protein